MPQKETLTEQKATIVNGELSGLNSAATDADLSQVAKYLNTCMDTVESIVTYHGGKIAHFTGSNFLAIFADKKNEKENATVALDTLLEIQTKLNNFSEDLKTENPIGLSAGIATGEVIFGEAGLENKRITLLGEAFAQAAKIGQIANKGQVLTEKITYSLCKRKFNFNRLEPIPVKGMEEPLQLFKLIDKKETKLTFNSEPGRLIQSKMVGREKEKELLLTAVTNLTMGEGGIVNIIGPAGTGKSRLVAEIKREKLFEKTGWFEGRGLSHGQNQSYHPIIHIFKSWAEIGEDDLPELSSQKLFTAIQQLGPQEANEIFPFIATMFGFPLSGKYKERVEGIEGEALEKLILKNLRDLIILASKQRPLVIMIEDMHWADSSSIAFFESLFKLAANHRVLFINVFRPGYEHTGDYLIKYLTENFPDQHLTISINPLAESESGKLITNLMNETLLPEEVSRVIIHKTKGNPFFIEEVIRSFLDDGIIEIKDKKFHLTEKIQQANIPETINEVILSRVDKLDEKTKELLKTASVIGRNFYYKVLEEAADTIGELDERLEYLQEVQLIGESNQKEEIEYLFKHALAQQATYESIVLNSKKELHLKIARSIEKVFAQNINEFYGTLAYHFEQADNLEKAEEYLILAGDEAMKTAASAEAIHYYEKVLKGIIYNGSALNNPKKVTDIEEKLAYAYYAQGHNIKAAEIFDRVLFTYPISKIPKNKLLLLLNVLISLANLYFNLRFWNVKKLQNTVDEDDRLFKLILFRAEAYASFSPKDSIISTLVIKNSFSFSKLISSDFGIGILITISAVFPWSGRGLGFARMTNSFVKTLLEIKDPFIWCTSRYTQALFDYLAGQLSLDSDDDKVFKLSMETGRVWPPTIHHAFKGVGYVELGMKPETEHLLENLLHIANELEQSFTRTQYYRVQQTYFLKYRKLDKVISNSEEVIKYVSKTDHISILLLVNCIASMAYASNGEIEKARKYYLDAEALSKKLWLKYYSSMVLMTKAYIEIAEINKRREVQSNDKKTELLKTSKLLVNASQKVNCNKTEAYRIRALAFAMNDQSKKALKYFQKSIEFANWYGGKLELSRTYFELGKFLSNPKTKKKTLNGLSAKDYLEKARQLFIEMDLTYDLAELENFMNK